MEQINFSRGTSTFDNCPEQRTVKNFDAFLDLINQDRSPEKGQTYICAALNFGGHYQQPQKYQGLGHWRLKKHAKDRRFLAFDFDGFSTPNVFQEVCDYFQQWNCLIYTTASHTDAKPRARAIVELDREVSDAEGFELGMAAQRMLEAHFGNAVIKFDESVYRAIQPIFTPVNSSTSIRWSGQPMNVDLVINSYPSPTTAATASASTVGTTVINSTFHWPPEMIKEGGRNEMMLRYVGHLRKRNHTEEEILVLALAMNAQRFDPALPEAEVASICDRYSHQSASVNAFHSPVINSTGNLLDSSGTFQVPITPPPRRNYVFAGQVTGGTLNVIGGQGGVSKTMLLMQTCAAAAVSDSMGDLNVSAGCSLLVLGEEDEAERDRRMGAICEHFNFDRSLVEQRVKCFAAAGLDIRLTKKIDANVHATNLGEEIIQIAKKHASNTGAPLKIVGIDHARLTIGGDPNNAEDVTQLTRVLTNIARSTGAAVVLLAHSPKSVAAKAGNEIGSSDIAGSSAFVDNARAAYMMWTMRKEEAKAHQIPETESYKYVRLENVKANYAKTGGGYWFQRKHLQDWEVAVLEQVTLYSPSLFESKGTQALRERILEVLRKKHGGVTERALRDMAGKAGVLKASDATVRKEVQAMLEDCLIDRRKPSNQERQQHRLGGGVREVLVVMNC